MVATSVLRGPFAWNLTRMRAIVTAHPSRVKSSASRSFCYGADMTNARSAPDPIEAVALLEEPNRRRLYDLIAGRRDPLGRDEAASALGISRELAAFHLERLLKAGLLEAEYRRLGGRTGPGAGRPAKLYRRSSREIAISLPDRRYGVAASVMASALAGLRRSAGVRAVTSVARQRGVAVGSAARERAATQPDAHDPFRDLVGVLREAGFEPDLDSTGSRVPSKLPVRRARRRASRSDLWDEPGLDRRRRRRAGLRRPRPGSIPRRAGAAS